MSQRDVAISEYLDAWRIVNSKSALQGMPTLTATPQGRVRIKNDCFDVVVTTKELRSMTENILKRR